MVASIPCSFECWDTFRWSSHLIQRVKRERDVFLCVCVRASKTCFQNRMHTFNHNWCTPSTHLHTFISSCGWRVVKVFLIRRAVRRAPPLAYQHSFMILAKTRSSWNVRGFENERERDYIMYSVKCHSHIKGFCRWSNVKSVSSIGVSSIQCSSVWTPIGFTLLPANKSGQMECFILHFLDCNTDTVHGSAWVKTVAETSSWRWPHEN